MPLFFQNLEESCQHRSNSQETAPKTRFQTAANEQSQTDPQQHHPPKLILSAHKKHPQKSLCGGRRN